MIFFRGGRLLGAGVLGDSLGALGHRVLCQLTRQQEPDSSLDLSARDGRTLVVVGQAGRLGCDALEDVVHEAVHDRHGLARHSGVRVDLLEHLVDVDAEALLPPTLLLLLVGGTHVFLRLAGLLDRLSTRLGRHPSCTPHTRERTNDDDGTKSDRTGGRASAI